MKPYLLFYYILALFLLPLTAQVNAQGDSDSEEISPVPPRTRPFKALQEAYPGDDTPREAPLHQRLHKLNFAALELLTEVQKVEEEVLGFQDLVFDDFFNQADIDREWARNMAALLKSLELPALEGDLEGEQSRIVQTLYGQAVAQRLDELTDALEPTEGLYKDFDRQEVVCLLGLLMDDPIGVKEFIETYGQPNQASSSSVGLVVDASDSESGSDSEGIA